MAIATVIHKQKNCKERREKKKKKDLIKEEKKNQKTNMLRVEMLLIRINLIFQDQIWIRFKERTVKLVCLEIRKTI